MKLAAFQSSIEPAVEKMVESKLADIERDHDVHVLFAVESGSRAWGFPSPDSDYDVRFVYARRPDWYLSLKPGRDVIELPIEGDWDINGWDIRKALNLLMKPNPVLLEWLSSPIRYRWSDQVCERLVDLANKTAFGGACVHHYRNVGQQHWAKHVGDSEEVSYKKYFYILRPALAIHWVRRHPTSTPPMNLQALVDGLGLDETLVAEIDKLLALKSRAKEIGGGSRVDKIDHYIRDQMDWAATVGKAGRPPDLIAEGDALFRSIIKREIS